jgi:hypothetical protein
MLRIAPPLAFVGDEHTFSTNTWLNLLTKTSSCSLRTGTTPDISRGGGFRRQTPVHSGNCGERGCRFGAGAGEPLYPGTGNTGNQMRACRELSCRSKYGDGRPDRGHPKAKRQEHCHDQRLQPDQPRMEGRLPQRSHPRPIVSALQQNSAVHHLLPASPPNFANAIFLVMLRLAVSRKCFARAAGSLRRPGPALRLGPARQTRLHSELTGRSERRSVHGVWTAGRTPNPVRSLHAHGRGRLRPV